AGIAHERQKVTAALSARTRPAYTITIAAAARATPSITRPVVLDAHGSHGSHAKGVRPASVRPGRIKAPPRTTKTKSAMAPRLIQLVPGFSTARSNRSGRPRLQ